MTLADRPAPAVPAPPSPHFAEVLAERSSRRDVLRAGVGAAVAAGLAPLHFFGCVGANGAPLRLPVTSLGFRAVGKSRGDAVVVDDDYTWRVLYATGDPIDDTVAEYRGDGSENDYDHRAGDHHDGIVFFGLDASGTKRDDAGTERALLAVNHEAIKGTAHYLHAAGDDKGVDLEKRVESEVRKEIDAHGVSIVAIRKGAGGWEVERSSPLNRRITPRTEMTLAGPAAGSDLVKTKYSPDGARCRGTLNNCASGRTPWGTYLTAEENWAKYFVRNEAAAPRPPADEQRLERYELGNKPSDYHRGWETTECEPKDQDEFVRWDLTRKGAGPTADFRNEANTFGYLVEIDPYDPAATPKKRTAMGRRANEGATHSIPQAGQKIAFYTGCDSRGEYVYKFVADAVWDPADAKTGGLPAGDKYLDRGTIYAARFDADGTGRWLPLTRRADGKELAKEELVDVCVHTRLAADKAGATPMDRPEWTAVNPFTGEVYVTLTENPDRGAIEKPDQRNRKKPDADAANPRYWLDQKAGGDPAKPVEQRGNVNGHIVRIREHGDDAAATTFRWDVFLFAAQAHADAGHDADEYRRHVNISGLTEDNDLSKPDGCWFSPATGILWIETDDNTYTDVTNCMLLACIPGRYGDGGPRDVTNRAAGSPDQKRRAQGNDSVVRTYVGRPMTGDTLRRFLVGPRGAEITGLAESADGKALFVNIQHPGETPHVSHWPGNAGYGPGGEKARPRSATIVITRKDGGLIGA